MGSRVEREILGPQREIESEFSWKRLFSLWHWIRDGVWWVSPSLLTPLRSRLLDSENHLFSPLSCAVGPCDLHQFPLPSVLDKPRKLCVSFSGSNPSGMLSLPSPCYCLFSLRNLGHSPVSEARAIFTNAPGTAYVSLCLRRDIFFCQSRTQVVSESLGLEDGQHR